MDPRVCPDVRAGRPYPGRPYPQPFYLANISSALKKRAISTFAFSSLSDA
jgi:hypothetical protein